ncbi:MAG: GNAT family N-acetyltransferase [Proteobacteria bacterium]|nr:GNAT family N-acetyltransferase [Pseudomonadota bacterium]
MSDITFRMATEADLPTIIAMLADDEIAENRENAAVPEHYREAFAAMAKEVFNKMLLAEQGGKIVGSMQLVFIPGVSRNGTRRALIESVRVRSSARGQNIGTLLMKEAIRLAKENGCGLVQLDSDLRRPRAHLFYRRLGFVQSHAGFKKDLT